MNSRLSTLFVSFVIALGLVLTFPARPVRARGAAPPFELVFPQETAKTHFSSSFGDYRSGGRRHKGNDLIAPRLTEVYAIADGVVYYVGINHLSGRNVKIDHGEGWESYYLHLNNDNPGTDDGEAPWSLTVAPGVEEGMKVEAGQLIAWVGDSGNAETTTPHTHFELHHNGSAVDPYPLLSDAYERAENREQRFSAFLAHRFDYPID